MYYADCTYFDALYPVAEQVLSMETDLISEMALSSISSTLRYLRIEKKIELASDLGSHSDGTATAMDKIIELVSCVGGAAYLNMEGSRALYDSNHFKKSGIKLLFLYPILSEYKQKSQAFVPRMSVIDLLMNVSPTIALEHFSMGWISAE